MVSTLDGGFDAPVFDAQAVFRAVMDAMARPGTVQPLARRTAPPAPLSATAAAVALALVDHDTPVWLDPALAQSAAVKAWLGFHTGAPVTTLPTEAHFALVAAPAELIALENFAQGSQEYPDRSTTLVLQVEIFAGEKAMVLEGPGIAARRAFAPAPLPRHFGEQWKQNRGRFPRGIDLILAGPDGIACLPRTTRLKAAEG